MFKLKKILIIVALFVCSIPCLSQVGAFNKYCTKGATQAITSGSNSSNYLDGIIPKCTVTVYFTGTTTQVPGNSIFSDGIGTILGNPFTANADGSWLFYAANGITYDVKMSGGGGNPSCVTQPNCYATPKTITGLINGGGSGGGVSQIIAGTNVSVSPVGGTGVVTVNSTGGGGGNPANTTIAFMGDSTLGSDDHALSASITVTAVACAAGVCTFTNSGTNGLAAGDWIDTQGISSPSFLGGNCITTGVCLFQVLSTGLTTTQFKVNYALNTGTGTGGTVYTANGYLPFQIMQQSYFKGHGIPYVHTDLINTAATDFATYFGPMSPSVTGNLGYLITVGDEDIFFTSNPYSCNLSSIESGYQSVWTAAHTLGYKIVQATTKTGGQNVSLGACTNATTIWQQTNQWIREQLKNTSNTASGAYIDYLVDFADALSNDNSAGLGLFQQGGLYLPAGIAIASPYFNDALLNGSKINNPVMVPNGPNGSGYDLITINSGIGFRVGNHSDSAAGTWTLQCDTNLNQCYFHGLRFPQLIYTSSELLLRSYGYNAINTATEDFQFTWYDGGGPSNNNGACFGYGYGVGNTLCMYADGRVSMPYGIYGPTSAPSGSCTVNGAWVFSQDGHATFCASGTWTTKI